MIMTFYDILNEYMELLQCSAKELAEVSGLSQATISRYRSGERVPEPGSDSFDFLVRGLADIAEERGRAEVSAGAVRDKLSEAVCMDTIDADKFRLNFNIIYNALSMSISDFARAMRYDPSYISRIKNGQRKPSNLRGFAEETARYIARTFSRSPYREIAAEIIGCNADILSDNSVYADMVFNWLTNGSTAPQNELADYLKKLDDFDLNEYIKAIHFDMLKVPSVPFQFASSRSAYGIKQMMDIELDFIRAVVLSKSTEDVISYSDMPIEEMSRDKEFPKKWMYGMALMLKKGLHINMIHNINRPFSEMMLGLESWIPLYMTGKISPYYISSPQNSVFLHFLKVSGTAALAGEAISGYQNEGKYYLTKKENEVVYYKKRAQRLMSKASPLMNIFDKDSSAAYKAFLQTDVKVPGSRRRLNSSLPVFTAPAELIDGILRNNKVPEEDRVLILDRISDQRVRIEQIMINDTVTDEITVAEEDAFQKNPVSLSISGTFYEKDIHYTYEEYLKHLEFTRKYAEIHDNYKLKILHAAAFKNIQISIHEGQWAVVSKDKSPCIHFMIFHPKMRSAIENMVIPIFEE
jgi:Predicted transcriptional regulator